ncbi:hypothetical protein BDK51DRAFT_30897, partial [Blyttiomyces helicus]
RRGGADEWSLEDISGVSDDAQPYSVIHHPPFPPVLITSSSKTILAYPGTPPPSQSLLPSPATRSTHESCIRYPPATATSSRSFNTQKLNLPRNVTKKTISQTTPFLQPLPNTFLYQLPETRATRPPSNIHAHKGGGRGREGARGEPHLIDDKIQLDNLPSSARVATLEGALIVVADYAGGGVLVVCGVRVRGAFSIEMKTPIEKRAGRRHTLTQAQKHLLHPDHDPLASTGCAVRSRIVKASRMQRRVEETELIRDMLLGVVWLRGWKWVEVVFF